MKVIEMLKALGDRLQVRMIVCATPTDGSGDLRILYANSGAASLFGYPTAKSMEGLDVRSLMPDSIANLHRGIVSGYMERANGGSVRVGSVMGQERALEGVTASGEMIPIGVNVADLRNTEERYFVAILRDRRSEVSRESELAEALAQAEEAVRCAQESQAEAEAAQRNAESSARAEKRLNQQVDLLKQIFAGVVGLVVMLGTLVVAQWSTGSEGDGLGMIKDVLLVLTGILGGAMTSVFKHQDDRRRDDR